MGVGRKNKAIEQKRREGNPGKRALPEPLKLGGALEKPADLSPIASETWDELVELLAGAGVADAVDRPALVALCLQWERGVVARRVLEAEGYFVAGSMGQAVEHPALKIESRAHQMFLRFAEQYGLTAAARAKIAAVAAGAKSSLESEREAIVDLAASEVVEDGEFEL
jgi:P27 family predicted phage terminase small subunit